VIISICLAIVAGVGAITLMLTIAVTIHGDGVASPAGQQAEVARLTAPLPEVPGRHSAEHIEAIGTETQRRLYDTMEIRLADVAEAVSAR
jgi:hypothetical protein